MEPVFNERLLTWAQIIEISPEVGFILQGAGSIEDDPDADSFCAASYFHGLGGLKEQLMQHVGFTASDARLKTSEIYDLVYRKVRDALPNCRNCTCGS